MIIRSKKDLASYVRTLPEAIETKAAYEEDAPGGFDEIEEELVEVIARFDGRPAYGTDWNSWLRENIDEMLQEAIEIVM